jgi:hypothetical protein
MTVGWYVRVTTSIVQDGVYDTVLYIAGFETQSQAIDAVRRVRSIEGEEYQVPPDGEIVRGYGPQPAPGEVRLIRGAH